VNVTVDEAVSEIGEILEQHGFDAETASSA
jgi:hypothetical protein